MNLRILMVVPILSAGCAVGPDYTAPASSMPDSFAGTDRKSTSDNMEQLAVWWQAFDDPVLDQLVERAISENFDIQIAASRIVEARMLASAARGARLPSLSGSIGKSSTEFSENAGLSSLASLFGGGSAGGGMAAPGGGVSTVSAGATGLWDLDIFGGKRRALESALASIDASDWTARDIRISVIAEIADTYFTLRALSSSQQNLRRQIDGQQGLLRLLQESVDAGIEPESSVFQQRSQVALSEATAAQQRGQMVRLVNAMSVLLALPVAELPAAVREPSPLDQRVPAPVAPGSPAALLERRPDIRAAERQLAASTANIGVATAALYPDISLTGVGEFISTQASNLFSKHSLQTVVSFSASFPILNFSRTKAAIGTSTERAQQDYLLYQRTVLAALADVNSALAAVDSEGIRNELIGRAVEDAGRSEQAAVSQFEAGITDYAAVYQAQINLFNIRDLLQQSDAELRRNYVDLYRALGGGW